MNLSKYSFLFNYIPSLKFLLNNQKLNFNQKKALRYIFNHYKKYSKDKNNKVELRKKLKEKISKFSSLNLKKKSLTLNKMIINSIEFQHANTVFCYISFDNEIDTFYILKYCLKHNKVLSVPVIKDNKMFPAVISNLENFKKNKYGILEPKDYKIINIKKIDLVIVPALGYNPLGYRIGYGGGYYDCFLKNFNGVSFGMVLKSFLIKNIIPEKHDLPVKKIFIQ